MLLLETLRMTFHKHLTAVGSNIGMMQMVILPPVDHFRLSTPTRHVVNTTLGKKVYPRKNDVITLRSPCRIGEFRK